MAAVIVLCYIFVGQLLEVDGDSMFPTFKDKEQLVAEKLSLSYKKPARGDILIFEHPTYKGELIIKRVIGMPQERIKISNGSIYINDNILQEPYLADNVVTAGNIFIKENDEYLIPENSYVMMGDNRAKSTDSRYWGPVSIDNMVGRGLFVYFPTPNFRFLIGD